MKRSENVDILRSIAIYMIVIYHCYAITQPTFQHFTILSKIIGYWGEIGVTLFFIMSGFGISCSLKKQSLGGDKISWLNFMKRRIKRVVPQYYVCLIIMLLLTDWSSQIAVDGLQSIVTHVFFIHNLWVATHGTINGAMWTMGTIVQFYVVAMFIQKLMERNIYFTTIVAVVITIVSKMVTFFIVTKYIGENGTYYFVYGRQLITALDNFVVGMCIGNIYSERDNVCEKWKNWIYVLIFVAGVFFATFVIDGKGLYTNTIWGWTWHSVLAFLLGGIVYFVIRCPMPLGKLKNALVKVSKYEYGIYIWHIVIIYNLVQKSPIFSALAQRSYCIFSLCIVIICTVVGYFSTKFIDE